jgi:heptosyltransferase-2
MSLPAIRALRARFPEAHLTVLARPWVADLYARESAIGCVIPYPGRRWSVVKALRREGFDCAILLQNAFEAALVARLAGIPRRIGYDRDGRGWLLTDAVPVPLAGEIPRHERFYYLELLRRSGIIEKLPEMPAIRLEGAELAAREGCRRLQESGLDGGVLGVSPGAAYGNAKRWLPERFAEAAITLAQEAALFVALFGSGAERELCEEVAKRIRQAGGRVHNFAGETTLAQFIELAAACRLFLTNDSGAMHIASALGVPTVAVFGATDHSTTGPTGPLARVVRQSVECSPCLLRECPIDHRCMTSVTVEVVAEAARQVANESRYQAEDHIPSKSGGDFRGSSAGGTAQCGRHRLL